MALKLQLRIAIVPCGCWIRCWFSLFSFFFEFLIKLSSWVLSNIMANSSCSSSQSCSSFCFFASEKYKQKVSMQILLLPEKVATETQVCRSCYFWKMWQKLKYADLAISGKCNRNLVCSSCYLCWKMQQNPSVCIFLLRLEMAMNSWIWKTRDLILQRVLGFTSLDANWERKVKQHKRTYGANQTVESLLTIVDVLDHSLLRFPKDHDASWIWVVLIFRWGGEGDDGVGDDFSVWWVCNWVWYEPLVVGWNWMFWVFYEPSVFCEGWRSSIYTQIW